MPLKLFEPVYYRKETATKRLEDGTYGATGIEKVRGNFVFMHSGKKVKRKTGWKLVGGWL